MGQAPREWKSPVEVCTGLQRFGGDLEFYLGMIGEFLAGLPERIRTIRDAAAAAEMEAAAAAAHGIRGAALMLEARRLARIAERIEATAESGHLAGVPTRCDDLQEEADRVATWHSRARAEPACEAAR